MARRATRPPLGGRRRIFAANGVLDPDSMTSTVTVLRHRGSIPGTLAAVAAGMACIAVVAWKTAALRRRRKSMMHRDAERRRRMA